MMSEHERARPYESRWSVDTGTTRSDSSSSSDSSSVSTAPEEQEGGEEFQEDVARDEEDDSRERTHVELLEGHPHEASGPSETSSSSEEEEEEEGEGESTVVLGSKRQRTLSKSLKSPSRKTSRLELASNQPLQSSGSSYSSPSLRMMVGMLIHVLNTCSMHMHRSIHVRLKFKKNFEAHVSNL